MDEEVNLVVKISGFVGKTYLLKKIAFLAEACGYIVTPRYDDNELYLTADTDLKKRLNLDPNAEAH